MNENATYTAQRSIGLSIRRGLTGRCPSCGGGRLFASYLKPIGACASCGEAYGQIRTDDAAPWLTILIVGHIIGPLIVVAEKNFQPEAWQQVVIFIPATLLLSLLLLPRAKGALLGLMWALRLRGDETQ